MTRRPDHRSWWVVVLVASLVALALGVAQLSSAAGRTAREVAPVADGGLRPSETAEPDPSPSPRPPTAHPRTPRPAAPRSAAPRPSDPPQPPEPTRLIIAAHEVDIPVVATGVAADGQMALPPRPSQVGWYRYGPRPGADGSAVLAGHVDSRAYGVGPLRALRSVRVGEQVVVQQGAERQAFRVRSVRLIEKSAVDWSEVFARSGTPTLRIVTCGGDYRREHGGYQDNVVVTATRI